MVPMRTKSKGTNEMPAEFWKWFDGVRRERDFSDRQMATTARISHSVISKARSGIQPIGYDALEKIASTFGLSTTMILRLAGRVGSDEALSPMQRLWLSVFDDLDEFDREELLGVAQARAKRGKNAKQAPAT